MSFVLLGILNSQVAGGLTQYYWVDSYYWGNSVFSAQIGTDATGNIVWGWAGNSPYPNHHLGVSADGATLNWKKYVTDGATRTYMQTASTKTYDSSGNAYVFNNYNSGTYSHIYKYASDGTLVWQRKIGDTGNSDVTQIHVNSSDEVFVCGGSNDGTISRGFLLKINPSDGTILWNKRIGSVDSDYIIALGTDSSNNIYALMRADGTGAGTTVGLIVKYDSSGTVLWQKYYLGGTSELPTAIRVLDDGTFYVTGWSYVSAVARGILLKFDSSGTLQWTRHVYQDNPGQMWSADVDADGNVYGNINAYVSGGSRAGLVKFDSSGNTLFLREFNPGTSTQARGGNMKIAPSGVMLISYDQQSYAMLWSLPPDGSLTGSTYKASTAFTIASASYTVTTSSLTTYSTGTSTSVAGTTTVSTWSGTLNHTAL